MKMHFLLGICKGKYAIIWQCIENGKKTQFDILEFYFKRLFNTTVNARARKVDTESGFHLHFGKIDKNIQILFIDNKNYWSEMLCPEPNLWMASLDLKRNL